MANGNKNILLELNAVGDRDAIGSTDGDFLAYAAILRAGEGRYGGGEECECDKNGFEEDHCGKESDNITVEVLFVKLTVD